jgi:perosamine synthetase
MKIEVYSPTIRRKEMDAVLTAMVEDRIGPGEQAKSLVQTAREKIKFDYCLSLRSPVIALHLALKALNLERGQGVLISALSPLYFRRVVEDLALVPYYCDVDLSTACVSRETLSKALEESQDIKCVILHHALGFVPDVDAVSELGVPVIEDCSRSYGTETGELAAVLTPVFTILGLEERDMLTSGGGALLYSANRRDSALLRGSGDLPPEYGLPDMNAALAVVQFKEAAKNLLKRREIAELYTQSAARTRHKMFGRQGTEYNNYAFPLILETGVNEVKAYARRKDIAVESAFENTLAGSGVVPPEKCPHAYSLSLRTVLFPLYPRLGMTKAGKVAKLIMTLP